MADETNLARKLKSDDLVYKKVMTNYNMPPGTEIYEIAGRLYTKEKARSDGALYWQDLQRSDSFWSALEAQTATKKALPHAPGSSSAGWLQSVVTSPKRETDSARKLLKISVERMGDEDSEIKRWPRHMFAKLLFEGDEEETYAFQVHRSGINRVSYVCKDCIWLLKFGLHRGGSMACTSEYATYQKASYLQNIIPPVAGCFENVPLAGHKEGVTVLVVRRIAWTWFEFIEHLYREPPSEKSCVVAKNAITVVMKTFWDWCHQGIPLSDMHGGNVAFTDEQEPRIWLIDWEGATGKLTEFSRKRFNAAASKFMQSLFGEWKDGRPACDNWNFPHALQWQEFLERVQQVTKDWIWQQTAVDDWCQLMEETCRNFVKDLPVPDADAPDTPRSDSKHWQQPWQQLPPSRVDTQGIAWLGMCAAAQDQLQWMAKNPYRHGRPSSKSIPLAIRTQTQNFDVHAQDPAKRISQAKGDVFGLLVNDLLTSLDSLGWLARVREPKPRTTWDRQKFHSLHMKRFFELSPDWPDVSEEVMKRDIKQWLLRLFSTDPHGKEFCSPPPHKKAKTCNLGWVGFWLMDHEAEELSDKLVRTIMKDGCQVLTAPY
jgi:hypothetical protein